MEGAYPLVSKAICMTSKTSRPIGCTYKFLGQVLSKEYEPTWLLKTQNQVPSESLVLKRSYGLYIGSIKDNPCYLMLRLVLVAHVSPLSNCHAMEDDNTKVCIKKQYPVCCY